MSNNIILNRRLVTQLLKKKCLNHVCLSKAESIKTKKVFAQFTYSVYKEFQREKRATLKFMNDNNIYKKLEVYSKKNYPELYEKRLVCRCDEPIQDKVHIFKCNICGLEIPERQLVVTEKNELVLIEKKMLPKEKAILDKHIKGWDKAVKPEKMDKVFDHWYPKAAAIGGNEALKQLGFNIAFNLKDPGIIAQFKDRGTKITGLVGQKTLKDFRSKLYDGYMQKGLSPYDVEKNIKGMFEETYKNRARTIARTETRTAQSITRFETYKKNDVKKKTWIALNDNKTRTSHSYASASAAILMEEFFDMGNGNLLLHPHDPLGPAGEIINCRCALNPIVVKSELPSKDEAWHGQDVTTVPANPNIGKAGYIIRKEQTYKPITGKIGTLDRIESRYASRGYDIYDDADVNRLLTDYTGNMKRRYGVKNQPWWQDALADNKGQFNELVVIKKMRDVRHTYSSVQANVDLAKLGVSKSGELVPNVKYSKTYNSKIGPNPGGNAGAFTSEQNKLSDGYMTVTREGMETDDVLNLFTHEYGHNYHFTYSDNLDNAKALDEWKGLFKESKDVNFASFDAPMKIQANFVTDYASHKWSEDFSEMFRLMAGGKLPVKTSVMIRKKIAWMEKNIIKKDAILVKPIPIIDVKSPVPKKLSQKAWEDSLSPSTKRAFNRWGTHDYVDIRGYQVARNDPKALKLWRQKNTKDTFEVAKQFTDTMEAAVVNVEPYKGTTYRGLRFVQQDDINKYLYAQEKNVPYTMEAFASTTIDKKTATLKHFFEPGRHSNALLTIKNKTGVRIDALMSKTAEQEVLALNNSKYKVITVKKRTVGDGLEYLVSETTPADAEYWHIVLEEL